MDNSQSLQSLWAICGQESFGQHYPSLVTPCTLQTWLLCVMKEWVTSRVSLKENGLYKPCIQCFSLYRRLLTSQVPRGQYAGYHRCLDAPRQYSYPIPRKQVYESKTGLFIKQATELVMTGCHCFLDKKDNKSLKLVKGAETQMKGNTYRKD